MIQEKSLIYTESQEQWIINRPGHAFHGFADEDLSHEDYYK